MTLAVTRASAGTERARPRRAERAQVAAVAAKAADFTCAHCGLPVPATAGVGDGDSSPRFCCNACGVAHAIIQGAGLGAYYERRAGLDGQASPVRASGTSYAQFDDPAFAARHVTAEPAGGARIEFFVSGIHCTACAWLLERLPRVREGVRSARFDLGRGALEVVFEPARVRPSEIARTLESLGYVPHPSSTARRDDQRRADRALLLRLGLAGALAGNVMLMALALYSGAATDSAYAALFRWGSLLLAAPL